MKLYKYTKHNIEELSKTGIYKITCLVNNKIYIGSASCTKSHSRTHKGFYSRWKDHINKLSNNIHKNMHLQNSWNKYGEDNFIFEILEFCDPSYCEKLELKWIDYYNSCNHEIGFNIIRQSLNNFKSKSNDTRLRISNSLKGHKPAAATIESCRKEVLQYDLSGNFIAEHKSMTDASISSGAYRSGIRKVCLGINKTANGFIWKYKNPIIDPIRNQNWKKCIKVLHIDSLKTLIFDSISDCSNYLKYNRSTIRSYINSDKPLENRYLITQINKSDALG